MEKAEQKKDNKALEALGAKADSLAQQIGPEYAKVMDGLEEVDPEFRGRKTIYRCIRHTHKAVQIKLAPFAARWDEFILPARRSRRSNGAT